MTKEVISGSVNHFGPRTTEKGMPAEAGLAVKTLSVYIEGESGVGPASEHPMEGDTVNLIPPHSVVVDARLFAIEAFAGESGKNLEVKLAKVGGGVQGMLIEEVATTLTKGAWITGDEVQVGKTTGDEETYVFAEFETVDDANEGRGWVVIRYITPPEVPAD